MTASGSAFRVGRYLTQKSGSARNECEDALAFNSTKRIFAVADGATEAFDSRYWARLLVRSWMANAETRDKGTFFQMAQRLGERAHQRWENAKLPWYAEEKARAGSYAAFVGIAFEPQKSGFAWRALAIGDSCLLQVRSRKLIRALPLSKPEEFGYRPLLLPSKVSALPAIEEQLTEHEGDAKHGDIFLLLSDAVASWFLAGQAVGAPSIENFQSLLAEENTAELDELIAEQRELGRMRNDDVAAIYIEVR